MEATLTRVCRDDWIRFQVPDKRVLEGFVQEVSDDGSRVLVGKAPGSPENEWHNLGDITILQKQSLGASE